VCPAHEYTLSNLKFALAVDPDNASLITYHQVCTQLRRDGQPTLPSTVMTEKAINPFLRSRSNAIMAAVHQREAQAQDEVATFAALRAWKNEFK
jgi:hydroxyacylglutathione hydrolase